MPQGTPAGDVVGLGGLITARIATVTGAFGRHAGPVQVFRLLGRDGYDEGHA
jgi:hypothetical protein